MNNQDANRFKSLNHVFCDYLSICWLSHMGGRGIYTFGKLRTSLHEEYLFINWRGCLLNEIIRIGRKSCRVLRGRRKSAISQTIPRGENIYPVFSHWKHCVCTALWLWSVRHNTFLSWKPVIDDQKLQSCHWVELGSDLGCPASSPFPFSLASYRAC